MEPKKPRSKTALYLVSVLIVLLGIGFYYAAALANSDNRPSEVERQS